jgi:hypothetical protein
MLPLFLLLLLHPLLVAVAARAVLPPSTPWVSLLPLLLLR